MSAQVLPLRPVPDVARDAEPDPPGRLPLAMRRAAELGLRSPPTILHRQIAARIVAGSDLDADDLEIIAEYDGADAALLCLGGPVGRLWAQEEQESRRVRGPLSFLFAPAERASPYEEGTRYWLQRERALRVPAELRLARTMMGLYRSWSASIIAALPAVVEPQSRVMNRRDLTAAELAALFDSAEAAAQVKATMGPKLAEVIRLAFTATVKEMALDGRLTWSPTFTTAEGVIGTKVVAVPDTVRAAVERVVNQGLAEGWTTAEMQAAIKGLPEMSAGRALTVARTESGRTVTEGTNAALQQAVTIGAKVKRRWVSARDAATRPSHRALEGVEVNVGEPWTLAGGTPTQGPGQSGVAKEDINCRCAVRPVVIKEPPP